MSIINKIVGFQLKKRFKILKAASENPLEIQDNLLMNLLKSSKKTMYGKKYKYDEIRSYQSFSRRIPLVTYEEYFPIISKILKGEKNISWPGKIKWFAKSSGTTNDKSKFITVSI